MIIAAMTTVGSLAAHEYQNNPDKVVYSHFHKLSNIPSENYEEMRLISNLNKRTQKPMLVIVASPPANRSATMTRQDWGKLSSDIARKMGFQDNQYSWAVHGNTDEMHLHITANRINFVGLNTVDAGRIGMRAGIIANEVARERGWETVKELTSVKKDSMVLAIRDHVATSKNWLEVAKKMEKNGYHIEICNTKKDNIEIFNGLRIMTLEEYRKRKEREEITAKALELGMRKFQNPIKAKEYGKILLPAEEQIKVLSKAEERERPGFSFSKLTREVTAKELDKILLSNVRAHAKLLEIEGVMLQSLDNQRKNQNKDLTSNDMDTAIRKFVKEVDPKKNVWQTILEIWGDDYQSNLMAKIMEINEKYATKNEEKQSYVPGLKGHIIEALKLSENEEDFFYYAEEYGFSINFEEEKIENQRDYFYIGELKGLKEYEKLKGFLSNSKKENINEKKSVGKKI